MKANANQKLMTSKMSTQKSSKTLQAKKVPAITRARLVMNGPGTESGWAEAL